MSRIVATKITSSTSSSGLRNVAKKEEPILKSEKNIEKSQDIKKQSEKELKKDGVRDNKKIILEKDKKKETDKKDLKKESEKDVKKDTKKEVETKKDVRKDSLIATKTAKLEAKNIDIKKDVKKEPEKSTKTSINQDDLSSEEYDDEDYDSEEDWSPPMMDLGVSVNAIRNSWSKAAQETEAKKLKTEVSGMGKDQLSSIASRFEKGEDSFKGQDVKRGPKEELEELRLLQAVSTDVSDKRKSFILENEPIELSADVIRGEKQDHGLENLPSLKNVKSRFENTNQDLNDKPKERINLNRAESIRKRMARFQQDGEDGELENGHESDDDITRDPDIIRETRTKEELSFKGLTSIKQKFEAGDIDSKENEEEEKKKLELDALRKSSSVGSAKSRFEGVSDECPVVPRSPSKSPRTTPSREFPPNHEIFRESQEREQISFTGARSLKEKFEKGDVKTEEEEEKAARYLAEKEKELGIFRSAKSKDYIEKFKQIESGAVSASKPLKSPSSQRRGDREGSPGSEDEDGALPAPGTARSLSMKFRQLSQPNDQRGERKPPRKITPPPDSINPNFELTNEPVERDPNVIRSDEINDELLPPSNYTKNLVAKFASIKDNPHANSERRPPEKIVLPTSNDVSEGGVYENEPIRDPTLIREADYEEELPQLTDHTKALKAKFENIKAQSERPRRGRAKFKGKKYSEINEPLGGMCDKCSVCDKTVYAMERMEADRSVIHKSCFKCSHCGANLRLENYTSSEGVLYCVPHFKQLFKAKGNYDEGFGREQHKDKWNRSRSTTPSREQNGDSSPEKENELQSPMQVDNNILTAEA